MSDGILRYQSTGLPVFPERPQPTEEELEQRRKDAQESNPSYQAAKAREAIAAARAKAETKDPQVERAEAIKGFDAEFPDIVSNPALLHQFAQNLEQRELQASARGERVDLARELPAMADAMRKELGTPTTDERFRSEALREIKESRGIK